MIIATAIPIPNPALAPEPMSRFIMCIDIGEADVVLMSVTNASDAALIWCVESML